MNQEIKARLKWLQLYEETGNAGLVYRPFASRGQRFGKMEQTF
jgi:hypothetical protein